MMELEGPSRSGGNDDDEGRTSRRSTGEVDEMYPSREVLLAGRLLGDVK